MSKFNNIDSEDERYHDRLREYPVLFASIGVLHTLLTAGIVFGWASLLPVLRAEGIELSAGEFTSIFTHGAIGNYLSSLPFGLLLDRVGPKICGVLASVLFGLGLVLCSMATSSTLYLDAGFALLGFAGPAIQLPTLHLARLFPGEAREGGSGGAALMMSAQAGAFDGGTMVFAIFSLLASLFGMPSRLFFRIYLIVPIFTLFTAAFFWPNIILPDATPGKLVKNNSFIGQSPYLNRSPYLGSAANKLPSGDDTNTQLKDAPLSVILTSAPFYCLGLWVAVHILKLNFVVATINDQLEYAMPDEPDTVHSLIRIFGAILPFGFVILPLVAYLLARSTMMCFQLANAIGILYATVLTFFPSVASSQILVVFTSVAMSRQLVYSTVFHQTGELFGFSNYGVLLGLTNVIVSAASLVQGPLVEWAEASHCYFWPNIVLLAATIPLTIIVYYTAPPVTPSKKHRSKGAVRAPASETTSLLEDQPVEMKRSKSVVIIQT
jgi:LAT3 family solute carrier family 43 protein 3